MKTSAFFGGALFVAAIALGCQQFEAVPLQSRPAATRPDPVALARDAARLEHPLLKSAAIDLSTLNRDGINSESAAIIAVLNNPALRVERQRRSIAASQLLQARLLPNPSLEATYEPVTGGNTLGALNAYSIGPNWEISALVTHDAKVAAAEAQSVSVTLDVAWQEWLVAQAARKAVFDTIALREQLAATEAVDQQLAEQARIIQTAVDAHQKTIVDASVAAAASAKAHSDFLQARHDFHHQQLVLNQALGYAPEAEIKLAASSTLPSSLQLPPESVLERGLEFHRLDLVALRFGYQSQEQALRAAILGQFPKVVIGIHPASDNTGVHSVGIGISVDIPIFDRNQAAIANAKATRQQLYDEFNSRALDSQSITAQTLADIQSLTEQIAAAEKTIPAIQRLVEIYRDALSRHEVDAFSAAAAQNDLLGRRIDLLKLKQQLADAEVALELATGRSLWQPLSSASQPSRPENP